MSGESPKKIGRATRATSKPARSSPVSPGSIEDRGQVGPGGPVIKANRHE